MLTVPRWWNPAFFVINLVCAIWLGWHAYNWFIAGACLSLSLKEATG